MKINEYVALLVDGKIDGWYLENPYVVLRYVGYEGEDQDPFIMETDWYSMAWCALIQLLPDDKIVSIMCEPDWFMKAAHQKYYEVVAEVELISGVCYNVDVFDGDIILVKKGDVDERTD